MLWNNSCKVSSGVRLNSSFCRLNESSQILLQLLKDKCRLLHHIYLSRSLRHATYQKNPIIPICDCVRLRHKVLVTPKISPSYLIRYPYLQRIFPRTRISADCASIRPANRNSSDCVNCMDWTRNLARLVSLPQDKAHINFTGCALWGYRASVAAVPGQRFYFLKHLSRAQRSRLS